MLGQPRYSVESDITVDESIGKVLRQPTTVAGDRHDLSSTNILIVGSDTRTRQGSGFGSEADARGNGHSDPTLLLHVAAGHKTAYAVSIPRDSRVTRPGCKADGTTDSSLKTDKFNLAFAVGGRGCIISAVTYLTKAPIDHFVQVDFDGFNALGGVTICSREAISDPIRPAGRNHSKGSGPELPKVAPRLDSRQVLALMRARYIGTGSDLDRLDRQHRFLSAVIREATSSGLLTDPARLSKVLTAVARSMTVDAGLSGDSLNTLRSGYGSSRPMTSPSSPCRQWRAPTTAQTSCGSRRALTPCGRR